MSPRRFRLPISLALLGAAAGAVAAELTIYRCTDAQGRTSLRDTPCRAGETQQTRAMPRPSPAPPPAAPALAPAAPSPVTPAPAAAPRHAVVAPPQPMYECVTPDGDRYSSDTGEGNPRWVPLWTLGYSAIPRRNPLGDNVGGPTPKPPGTGPGPPRLPPDIGLALTPGTWIRDECYELPPQEVCARLRDRRYELGRRYNSALQSERHQIDAEQRLIDARLDNDCGGA